MLRGSRTHPRRDRARVDARQTGERANRKLGETQLLRSITLRHTRDAQRRALGAAIARAHESELAGVPIGGAATVCARTPHIGAAAAALEIQPSDSTNAARVHSRTNQSCRVWVAGGMGRARGSLVGRLHDTTRGLAATFPAEFAFRKPLTFHVSFLPTFDYLGRVGAMDARDANGNDKKSQENMGCDQDALPRRFERYTLLKRIARGGMGEVYLATAGGIEGAERPCVVKTIRREHEADRSFLARFLDEARIQPSCNTRASRRSWRRPMTARANRTSWSSSSRVAIWVTCAHAPGNSACAWAGRNRSPSAS